MHQVPHTDQNWRKLDEMCYRKLMDTELLKDSWEKLTQRGYTLNSPAPEVVNIITPTGYLTQIRLKRLPSFMPATCGEFPPAFELTAWNGVGKSPYGPRFPG